MCGHTDHAGIGLVIDELLKFGETQMPYKEFHTHIDAQQPISEEFERFLVKNMGFAWSQFDPPATDSPPDYYPSYHLTLKTYTGRDFTDARVRLDAYLEDNADAFEGYVEHEIIGVSEEFDCTTDFDGSVPLPFLISGVCPLNDGSFRASEFHFGMSADDSDIRLIDSLTKMGLMTIFNKKTDPETGEQWRQIIFTVQGDERKLVESMCLATIDYVRRAGGGRRVRVKEEKVLGFWLSSPNIPRPPVVTSDTVKWSSVSE